MTSTVLVTTPMSLDLCVAVNIVGIRARRCQGDTKCVVRACVRIHAYVLSYARKWLETVSWTRDGCGQRMATYLNLSTRRSDCRSKAE